MSEEENAELESAEQVRRALELIERGALGQGDSSQGKELQAALEWLLQPPTPATPPLLLDELADEETVDDPPTSPDSTEELSTKATHRRFANRGEIARGGMGAIWKVYDRELRRTVAMKIALSRSGSSGPSGEVPPQVLSRFVEEAQVTSQLDHPGIVPVHELGLGDDGQAYFTMKMVKGRNLRELLEENSEEEWSQTRLVGVVLKVCEAMSYAHDKGVLHRDLKPANVMVGRYGEVYVMDWGLARAEGRSRSHDLRLQPVDPVSNSTLRTDRADAREESSESPLITMDGAVVGTPYYMPPEQARGQIEAMGPRSDVYSVGAMLYRILSGRAPYREPGSRTSPRTILAMVLHAAPPPILQLAPQAPPELVSITERAMAREPEQRYGSMTELAEDLRAWLEGRVVQAHGSTPWQQLGKWIRRNKTVAAAFGLAALSLAIGAALALQQRALAVARASHLEAALDDKSSALRLADAHRLAAESLALGDKDPTLALLLAIEAGQRTASADVNRALYAALEKQRELHVFTGHESWVPNLAVSPDGRFAHSVDGQHFHCGWDLVERRPLWRSEQPGFVTRQVGFSKSGRYTVALGLVETEESAGKSLHEARLWRSDSGELIGSLPLRSSCVALKALPDSDDFLVAEKRARLVRIQPESLSLETVTRFAAGLEAVDLHDGMAAALDQEHTVHLWPWGRPEETRTIEAAEHTRVDQGVEFKEATWPGKVALSHDLRTVTVLWEGSHLGIFDVATGERVQSIEDRQSRGYLRMAPNRKSFYQNVRFETGQLWPASGGPARASLGIRWSKGFSRDSRCIFGLGTGTGGNLDVYEVETGQKLVSLVGHEREIRGTCSVGAGLVLTSSRDRTLRLWSIEPGASLHEDPRYPPSLPRYRIETRTLDGEPWLHGMKGTRGVLHAVPLQGDAPELVVKYQATARQSGWGPRGRRAWLHGRSEGPGSKALVWDRDEQRVVFESPLQEIGDHQAAPTFALSADERLLAVPHPGGHVNPKQPHPGTLFVFDVDRGAELLRLETNADPRFCAFSPSGKRLALVHRHPAVVTLWNLETGTRECKLKGHTSMALGAAFHPDGSHLATFALDTTVRIYDLATRECVRVLRDVGTSWSDMSWSPAGDTLLVNSRAELRHYEVASGRLLMRWSFEQGPACEQACFSEDGEEIWLLMADNSLRRHPRNPLARCEQVAPRPMTSAEMQHYGIGEEADWRLRDREVALWRNDSSSLVGEARRLAEEGQVEAARQFLKRARKQRSGCAQEKAYRAVQAMLEGP